ncbi:zona pellucida protein AX 1 [Rhinichthys klamathensis goyatoka]|uniref:zona pellucida protein AX 1 n=1 Tax=Rhinichthys klamathensis goyatoka TaxID=3034132 RepID=UPI0024B56933|nr:zona pellucida protein AX 1 [Rhinichthys klamathensis goyatoka]
MPWLSGICTLWLLGFVVLAQNFNVVSPQKNVIPAQNFNQRTGLKTDCLGSYMRLTVDKSLAFGSLVEFDVMNGSQIEPLTPSLASKCGFSIDSDPWGNYRVFASLFNCFAENEDDHLFDINMRVRVRGVKAEQDVFQVEKTCTHDQWAPREVLCDRNYMEVSVNRLPGEITAMRRQPKMAERQAKGDYQWPDTVSEAITSKYNIWRMVFFTPKQKAMVLEDALKAGYGVITTKSRLVLRSGFDMPETYVENVNGIPMKVIKVTTYFKRQWSVTMLDTVAACPVGGLSFTDEMITWYFPRVNPLMTSTEANILGMFMGIDGSQIDSAQMATRGYILTIEGNNIVMKIPIGGPDGYYKSHAVDNQYNIRYYIEPMLQLLWSEGGMDSTKYRVLFPIKTPFMPRPPQFVDLTDVDKRMFDVILGPFLYDVELVNITFSAGVLTLAEANVRGFNIQEQRFQNGSKAFRLQVPFSDSFVVRTQTDLLLTVYNLRLVYGFMIFPESISFSYIATVDVTLQDITLPTVGGSCDKEKFYITISYGNLGKNFNIMLGKRDLTPDLSAEYDIKENVSHMSLVVPFLAFDVAFELMYPSSLRARLDVLLWEPVNKWTLSDFSLACNFPMTMTECFSNGSMSALAVKVESVPQLNPSQLTLRDHSCRPKFSNDRFAYFSYDANGCGTTRKFYDGVMMYQNEIILGNGPPVYQQGKSGVTTLPPDPEYRVTVSCFYTLNDTQTIAFFTKPRENEPLPETGFGELHVVLRLALDGSYNNFYAEEDYPVVQYLRSPLFFEVVLLRSTDPQIELVLESCWATLKEDRISTPRWDLIVDGCVNLADNYETIFHPVTPGGVPYPSHVKHFEIKMFTFVQNHVMLQDQIYVHCDAVLCDANQNDGICKRLCPSPIPLKTGNKVRRDATNDQNQKAQLSTGKILLSAS